MIRSICSAIERGAAVTSLYQVCWDISDPMTRDREIRGLLEASASTACTELYIIISDCREDITLDNGVTVRVLPAWKWLLTPLKDYE